MDLSSRPEYLHLEAAVGARKLVEQVMLVKPGEDVVLTADTAENPQFSVSRIDIDRDRKSVV